MTFIAWWLINLAYHTRPMYRALSKLNEDRAFGAINPGLVLLDGFIYVVIGVLILFLLFFGVVTFPITSLFLFFFNREDWTQMRALIKAGRMDWTSAKIKDPVQETPNG